jgi:hypothetical protein
MTSDDSRALSSSMELRQTSTSITDIQRYIDEEEEYSHWIQFGGAEWRAQIFVAEKSWVVHGLLLPIGRELSSDNCTFSLRHVGATDYPTGADIAAATLPGEQIPSNPSMKGYVFFSSPCTLVAGQKYAIVVRAPEGELYWYATQVASENLNSAMSEDSGLTWLNYSAGDNFNFSLLGIAQPDVPSSITVGYPGSKYLSSSFSLGVSNALSASMSLRGDSDKSLISLQGGPTDADNNFDVQGNTWLSQPFDPSKDHLLYGVNLTLLRHGLCGPVTVGLREYDLETRSPIGSDLAACILAEDQLPEEEPLTLFARFSAPYQLSRNKKYALVIRAPDANDDIGYNTCTVISGEWGIYYEGYDLCFSYNRGTSWENHYGISLLFELIGRVTPDVSSSFFVGQQSSCGLSSKFAVSHTNDLPSSVTLNQRSDSLSASFALLGVNQAEFRNMNFNDDPFVFASGRYWIFYRNQDDEIVYKSTVTPERWPSQADEGLDGTQASSLSVIWHNGYFYLFGIYDYRELFYVRGEPQPDGSIQWIEYTEVPDINGTELYAIYACIDTEGHIWISYIDDNRRKIIVSKSENTDGTWHSTAAGFPFDVSEMQYSYGKVVSLSNGKVVVVFSEADEAGFLYARLWNGAAWESIQQLNISLDDDFNLLADLTKVRIVAEDRTDDTLIYVEFNPDTGFSEPEDITYGDFGVLSKGIPGDDTIIHYVPDDSWDRLKRIIRFSNGTLSTPETVSLGEVDFVYYLLQCYNGQLHGLISTYFQDPANTLNGWSLFVTAAENVGSEGNSSGVSSRFTIRNENLHSSFVLPIRRERFDYGIFDGEMWYSYNIDVQSIVALEGNYSAKVPSGYYFGTDWDSDETPDLYAAFLALLDPIDVGASTSVFRFGDINLDLVHELDGYYWSLSYWTWNGEQIVQWAAENPTSHPIYFKARIKRTGYSYTGKITLWMDNVVVQSIEGLNVSSADVLEFYRTASGANYYDDIIVAAAEPQPATAGWNARGLLSTISVRNIGSTTVSSKFIIEKPGSKPLSSSFSIRKSSYARFSSSFQIRNFQDLRSSFKVTNTPSSKGVSSSLTILSNSHRSLRSNFRIRKRGSTACSSSFSLRRPASKPLISSITVRSSRTKAYRCSLTVRNRGSKANGSSFTLARRSLARVSSNITVQNRSAANLHSKFSVGHPASKAASSSFTLRKTASTVGHGSLTIRHAALKNYRCSITVRNRGSNALSCSFYIKPHENLSCSFQVRKANTKALRSSVYVRKLGSKVASCKFIVRKVSSCALSGSITVNRLHTNYRCSITVRSRGSKAASSNFTLARRGVSRLSTNMTIRNTSAATAHGKFTIGNPAAEEASSSFTLRKPTAAAAHGNVTVRHLASKNYRCSIRVRNRSSRALSCSFYVKPRRDLSCSFSLRRSTSKGVSSSFYVRKLGSQTGSSKFTVRKTTSKQISSSFTVKRLHTNYRCSITVRGRGSKALSCSFRLSRPANVSLSVSLTLRKPSAANLHGKFTIGHPDSNVGSSSITLRKRGVKDEFSSVTVRKSMFKVGCRASFTLRRSSSEALSSSFSVRRPGNLSSSFTLIRSNKARARANFTVRNQGSRALSSSINVVKSNNLSSSFQIAPGKFGYVQLSDRTVVTVSFTTTVRGKAETWMEDNE